MSFDLVIQGPLDKTSIDKIDDISDQFENVIISHWSENDSSLLQGLKSKNITVCHQPTPDRQKSVGVLKDSTFLYSITSTYLGLQKSQSKYTIKMRSDEIYTDFEPLKEKFLQDDNKFVFGNIFAKKWGRSGFFYHIGDHLFVAKTSSLQKAYGILYNLYNGRADLTKNSWAIQGLRRKGSVQTAEVVLALSFVNAKQIQQDKWYSFETFKDNFDVIDINLLGKYVASWKHGYQTYSSDNNPFDWGIKTMEDMRDN